MIKKLVAFFLIMSFCLPFFSSCKSNQELTFETFEYFDTHSTLKVYGKEEECATFVNVFESTLEQYHQLFDIHHSYKDVVNLKSINDSESHSKIKVSKELFDALAFGIAMHEKTNGKLNVAMGAVTSIWHELREKAATNPDDIVFPSENTINEALRHTDINSIILDEETLSLTITDPLLSLDFGAIAKGYVTSLIYERFISLGCESFLINLGGNVLASGAKPDGSNWLSLIENPFDDSSLGYNKTVALKNATLVTSGSYQRYFVYNGKSYAHIIDPQSGYPSERFTSVSIKAPASQSGLADALSTALFCMSYEEGLALVSSIENVDAVWIFNDGSYKATDGFGGSK